MRIAVIGGGGREHALGWKLSRSSAVERLVAVPGNAGWAKLGECWTDADWRDAGFAARLRREGVGLVVIGPETPLVEGLADRLRDAGLDVFGPGAAAARLEASKAFAKDFLTRHGIPTAEHAVFREAEAAKRYVRDHGAPIVIKADGLCAGKGVVVATTVEEAEAAIDAMLTARIYGKAGETVVIEEALAGEEVSALAWCDGRSIVPASPCQDHKRAFEDDRGPNTGGMGVITPTALVDDQLAMRIQSEVMAPTLAGLQRDGLDFRGMIYAGLMIDSGTPKVLEYNVRFGDPECQPLMLHLRSDLAPLIAATAAGRLADVAPPVWRDGSTVAVVMAAGGYPGPVLSGVPIPNLAQAPDDDLVVFQAGTAMVGGRTVTAGGRVLTVTAHGADIMAARAKAYAAVERLRWPGATWRRDIGIREVERRLARRA